VVCRWSCLAFGNTFNSYDILLVRAVRFLIIVIIAVGGNCNPSRAPLSPPFAALGALLRASMTLDGAAW
jgi:hypothetical protein